MAAGASTPALASASAFRSKQLVGEELVVCFGLQRRYHLPAIYESADAETVQRCLTLGADSFVAIRELEESAAQGAGAAAAVARAVRSSEEKAAKTTWKLEQELERLRQERADVVEEAAKLRAEFAGLQATFQDRLEVARLSAAADAERRAISLESKLGGLYEALNYMKSAEEERVQALLEREAGRRLELLDAKEAIITVLKVEKERREVELTTAQEERVQKLLEREAGRRLELLEAKEAIIAVLKVEKERREVELAAAQEALLARKGAKANSAIKGQLGEEEFAELAAGQGWRLERTAKESRSCDYRGEVHGMPVFFEIKAHERRVQSAEVDKFKRDMNEHPEVGAGVFLALHAGIVGSRVSFWTEYTGDGRLLIFLSDVLGGGEEVTRLHLAAIAQLLEVAVYINKARLAGEGDQLDAYKGRVEAAEKYILTVKERTRELINTLHSDKRNLLTALQASYERLAFMIRGLQTDIQMTLGALLGTAVKFDENEEGAAAAKEVVIDDAGITRECKVEDTAVTVSTTEKPKKRASGSRKAASGKT
jgi:hypothetical protein